MNDRNRENLAELIERFFDTNQAKSVIDDIRRGEQLLRDNPAPKPNKWLIADIKEQISLLLPARRAQFGRRAMFRKVAAAAAFIIIAAISTKFFDFSPSRTGGPQLAGLIPTAIWESNDITADDKDLAVFAAEIDQIENEVMILENGDRAYESNRAVEELEIEITVVSSDFWKE